MEVEHIKQEDGNGCVIAAIAMATGKSYKEVAENTDRDFIKYGMTELDKVAVIEKLGFQWEHLYPPDLSEEGIYLIAVPSLNLIGHFHCIVVECNEHGYKVFDPQVGNHHKFTYTNDTLISYGEVIKVCKKDEEE